MIRIPSVVFCCVLALGAPAAGLAQIPQSQAPAVSLPNYAMVAGQVVNAPLILDARIRSATRLNAQEAPDLAPGRARMYIEADVLALIRGSGAIPVRVTYVADVSLSERGKAPKLKKQRVLLFARAVAGRADQIQLTGLDSQQMHSPALDSLVRGITQEVVASNAPPAVTGVGNAFHVPGSLPGEGETQVFLTTPNNEPVSLQIVRAPGQRTRWGVSLGDIVDNTAPPPARNTLLWYRLACGLPRTLAAGNVDAEDADNARIAAEDYAMVVDQLGPCR